MKGICEKTLIVFFQICSLFFESISHWFDVAFCCKQISESLCSWEAIYLMWILLLFHSLFYLGFVYISYIFSCTIYLKVRSNLQSTNIKNFSILHTSTRWHALQLILQTGPISGKSSVKIIQHTVNASVEVSNQSNDGRRSDSTAWVSFIHLFF